jgi:hypothetical protein
MWVNIQRIIGVAHCANVVWPDLELTDRERQIVLAGGLLRYVGKESGR